MAGYVVFILFTFMLAQAAPHEAIDMDTVSKGEARRLKAGLWGGKHVSMKVSQGGATLEFDCAHGAIDQAIMLDDKGRFDVKGYFVMEQGGPARSGDADQRRAARYAGRLEGKSLRLTITLDGISEPIDTFTLAYGASPEITKCL
jgi:hypothetical protein